MWKILVDGAWLMLDGTITDPDVYAAQMGVVIEKRVWIPMETNETDVRASAAASEEGVHPLVWVAAAGAAYWFFFR